MSEQIKEGIISHLTEGVTFKFSTTIIKIRFI